MAWHPSQPNGWFPKLQRHGDRILVLYGQAEVWVAELTLDLQPVREVKLGPGYVMGWIGPGVATWHQETGQGRMRRMEAVGPLWTAVAMADDEAAVAGNIGVADGGHWATYLASPAFRTVLDGAVVSHPSGGALTMAWPWLAHASTNDNLFARRYHNGVKVGDLPTAVPMNTLRIGPKGSIAYGRGPVAAHGPDGSYLGLQMVTPWRWEDPVKVVSISGIEHLVTVSYRNETEGVILIRPFGATKAQVVDIYAVGGDVIQADAWLVIAGYGSRGELTVTRIPVDQPAEDLAITLDPLPKGFVSYWFTEGRYGPHHPKRIGTVISRGMFADGAGQVPTDWGTRLRADIVEAGGGFVEATDQDLDAVLSIWDRIHGVWLHEPATTSINSLADKARAKITARGLAMRPIIAVLGPDQVFQDGWVIPERCDWLAVECYEPNPGPQDWWSAQAVMSRRIDRVLLATGSKPIILVGQAYDRRTSPSYPVGFCEDALEAYQSTTIAAWRTNQSRVLGVWPFAYARPGGVLGRPHVERWIDAAVAACPGLPAVQVPDVPDDGGNMLKITIEGTFPVHATVAPGGSFTYRAVAKITSGEATRFEWRSRPVAGSWTVVAKNPASDLDHHFTFGPGEYQIGLDAYGPNGGEDHTGSERRIVVAVQQPDPGPDPEPEPTPDDVPDVTFQTNDNGFFLSAENAGGWPGESFNGQPAGLVTARYKDQGGWQKLLVRPGAKLGTFGFRTANDAWFSLQDDGRLIANSHQAADYQPDGRQAFTLVDAGNGQVALQASNGKFVAAIQGGGGDVIADRDSHGVWEHFTPSTWIAIPDVPPEPDRVDRAIVGIVRPFGKRGIQDDIGPFLATTISRFYFMNCWATDRGRAERELDMDAAYVYHPRVLAEVGDLDDSGFWANQGWDPDDPRTEQQIADISDAAAARGIRVQWTAIGKGPKTDTPDKRLRLVQRVGGVLKDRPGTVLFGEVINEPNANWDGPSPSELLDLAEAFHQAAGGKILIATGAVWTEEGWVPDNPSYQGATAMSTEGWQKTQYAYHARKPTNAMGIVHCDRDTSKSEQQDRPARQPWDAGLQGDRYADNEAIGLGSSVNSESRPTVLRAHRMIAHICRASVSCLHGSPGVRGLERWEDQGAYHEVWKSRRFLDPDMVNGQQLNANSNYPDRPFDLDEDYLRAETQNRKGIVRAYSVQAPNGTFYTAPFGPVDYTYPDRGANAGLCRLVARRRLHVQAFQQGLGILVWEKTVDTGGVIEIDSKYFDLLLVSR